MNRTKAGGMGRAAMLAAIAGIVALVAVLPLFGRPAYAAGLNLNQSAAYSEFIIPQVFSAKLAAPLAAGAAAPVAITLDSDITTIFPATGELVLGMHKNDVSTNIELVQYDLTSCGAITNDQVCVTLRAKVGATSDHAVGTQAKLATQLTSPVSDTDTQTTLSAAISATAGGCTALPIPEQNSATCPDPLTTPFKITIADRSNFPATGAISITHQEVQTANLFNAGNATEYMEYDLTSCGSINADQLCIVARAQQSNETAYSHSADGFTQPGTTTGKSKVDLQFQIDVKSNAGFFPSSYLVVYTVSGDTIVDAELMGMNNAAPKIKTPAPTEFHIAARAVASGGFNKTLILAHPADSIVTGPDYYTNCRNGNWQPGVDTDLLTPGIQEPLTQVPGTSVGEVAVCYNRYQSDNSAGKGWPMAPDGQLAAGVPIVGSDLLVMASIAGQPFLSTGGFNHVVLGPVPHIDNDGTSGDAQDLDGDLDFAESLLGLISPCVLDYTPGTNLQVTIHLNTDKDFATPDTGKIQVVLDTVHDSPNDGTTPGDDCDDPAGWDDITVTSYIWPADTDHADDDTDGDGCSDVEELQANPVAGGVRDPWNPYDYFDVNGDSYIDLFNDILGVINAYTAGGGTYVAAADRGSMNHGPFGWNRSEPDGTIDLFNDILGVIGQYQHDCRPAP